MSAVAVPTMRLPSRDRTARTLVGPIIASQTPVAFSSRVCGAWSVATMSTVPGLYADLSEQALEARYRDKIRSWAQGDSTPADGKYRPFLPDQTYTIPPALQHAAGGEGAAPASRAAEKQDGLFGTVEPVSILLVNRFVVPFELTAILLLAAIIGAVIIAKKRL